MKRLMRASGVVNYLNGEEVKVKLLTTGGTHFELGDNVVIEWYGEVLSESEPPELKAIKAAATALKAAAEHLEPFCG